jgi:hypothetical protein
MPNSELTPEVKRYLNGVYNRTKPLADAHWAGFVAFFKQNIPAPLWPYFDFEVDGPRPAGFSESTTLALPCLRIPEHFEITCQFVYDKEAGEWSRKDFQIAISMLLRNQITSLESTILISREYFVKSQELTDGAPLPEAAPHPEKQKWVQ